MEVVAEQLWETRRDLSYKASFFQQAHYNGKRLRISLSKINTQKRTCFNVTMQSERYRNENKVLC